MAKKTRARTERRVRERAARELVRDRQKLAALLPGGSPERPIAVTSAAVIVPRVRSTPCPLCQGDVRVDHESAESRNGRLLHAAHVTCVRCGVARVLWFEVAPSLPS
jgi:hypothetical protein